MQQQNVTVSLPKTLVKRARALAALREESLSEFMRESLEEKVREATRYKRAKSRQIKILHEGLDLGTNGSISVSRGELHER
jgi:Arc/MetJ-type ribon-helix-helix transcriptional regulator